jgi:glycosyltransferase involved in cell wall biosynthesis
VTATVPHLSVCVCAYRRPALLARLLDELRRQDTGGAFTFSVIVADNDAGESSRTVVGKFAGDLPIAYAVQPVKNIALARNTAVANATGEFVVFIDDDEFPAKDWLRNLLSACTRSGAAGVLGPVLPHFSQEPPAWVRKGGFYDRPTHETGFVMDWAECRTGNVLFRRDILDEAGKKPFRPEFGSGGEDQDFFRRMTERHHTFIWCNEAAVYEVVPPGRWKRSVLVKRALLRGRNSLQHPVGRTRRICESLVAVPLYTAALPFLFLAGEHWFMRYAIKLGDHVGRLLALCGLNPIHERCDGVELGEAGAKDVAHPVR